MTRCLYICVGDNKDWISLCYERQIGIMEWCVYTTDEVGDITGGNGSLHLLLYMLRKRPIRQWWGCLVPALCVRPNYRLSVAIGISPSSPYLLTSATVSQHAQYLHSYFTLPFLWNNRWQCPHSISLMQQHEQK